MRMTSKGSRRDRGEKPHIEEHDPIHVGTYQGVDALGVRVKIVGKREYELILTTEEIITCLLKAPRGSIAKAIKANAETIEIPKQLPDLIKQMLAGAIPGQPKE